MDATLTLHPFSFQSKELNQVIELNWEDWCWFWLLLCSDRSSFFLPSPSGEVKPLYGAARLFLAKLLCLLFPSFVSVDMVFVS